jgi:hypothetical protein
MLDKAASKTAHIFTSTSISLPLPEALFIGPVCSQVFVKTM